MDNFIATDFIISYLAKLRPILNMNSGNFILYKWLKWKASSTQLVFKLYLEFEDEVKMVNNLWTLKNVQVLLSVHNFSSLYHFFITYHRKCGWVWLIVCKKFKIESSFKMQIRWMVEKWFEYAYLHIHAESLRPFLKAWGWIGENTSEGLAFLWIFKIRALSRSAFIYHWGVFT